MKYFEQRSEASIEHLTYVAWRIATLSRAKKIPPLKTLLPKSKRGPKPRQTADQMMTIAKMWTVHLGGEIVSKRKH